MSSEPGVFYSASALRSTREEFAGALTHGIGAVLSVVGSAALLTAALAKGDPLCVVGCAFYSSTLVAVYTASTLSHLYLPEQLNRLFRSLDQGFIYLLIVGTLTPFVARYLRSPLWLGVYLLIMAIGTAGFLSKTVFAHRVNRVCVGLYIVLGWGEAILLVPLLGEVPPGALTWVAAGGVSYTLGTVFLVLAVRQYHFLASWHLCVIAGKIGRALG